ncbi:homoserine dehydrogenase-domain-containing protein [Flagelloscypha sp. PMI_526]|nr:homoserine dehydrogenase-domain-containing protein [Flagelloscypha sp. PMI_526]
MASPRTTLVAVIGTGLVGSAFIKQLLSLPSAGQKTFKLVYLASSRKSLWFSSPPSISSWKESLTASPSTPEIPSLITKLQSLVQSGDGTKAVVVDNTSDEGIASAYPLLLRAGISVVTPNKKAFSGSQSLFEDIVTSAEKGGSSFLNESTAGAGLPIIGTLKDLVATGDKILKIEGVFSGTMSYIFNNFSPATPSSSLPSFSEVVKIAKQEGYTEPHPADDLNGFDVARKLAILSRFATSSPSTGVVLQEGFKSVNTRSLIPPELEGVADASEFMSRLPEFDASFDKLRKEASNEGKILRYVGVVDLQKNEVKASLESYPTSHPLATLQGSDNIILFHTERYGARPLIVQGAGAGADVTAMGVLADLLRLG